MKFYKFLIPLFALALLIGCTSTPDMTTPSTGAIPAGFDGVLLSGKHTVVIKTTMGDITLELDADKAPKTVTNFVTLAKSGYYNGLTFHRVIPRFMIQGGDPSGDGTGGASIFGAEFEDEINDMKLVRGAIAMANRGPNTNGSQFFIVQADATPWLDGRHTVFGMVTAGEDVVDKIASVKRDQNDMPLTPVTYTVEVK
jgi:cyclophilin family peptidyl-prolyl cis-trans isomerase